MRLWSAGGRKEIFPGELVQGVRKPLHPDYRASDGFDGEGKTSAEEGCFPFVFHFSGEKNNFCHLFYYLLS